MRRLCIGWVCAIASLHATWANAGGPSAPPKKADANVVVQIPWADLDERATTLAKQMMDKHTVQARGPAETFCCTPQHYAWLLDNPDRAVSAWRRLGAKCVTIQRRGQSKFGYADDLGSDVTWETVHQSNGVRIWFAEGKVKASPLLPLVPVKAIVVLRHTDGKLPDGNLCVQHQTDVVIHTDSMAAAAVTKLMGQSAAKLAEQGLGQLQLFFSALSCYLDRHPDHVEALFRLEPAKSPPHNPEKR